MNQHYELFKPSTQQEHGLLRRYVDTLCEVADAKALRRTLYGLAALLRLHLAQADIYLSLLSAHLTPDAAQSTWDALQDATRKAEARIAGTR